jgi:hypothetical protein
MHIHRIGMSRSSTTSCEAPLMRGRRSQAARGGRRLPRPGWSIEDTGVSSQPERGDARRRLRTPVLRLHLVNPA